MLKYTRTQCYGDDEMTEYLWSKIEKKKARKIFNEALLKEYDLIIKRVRDLANAAASPQDIWEINSYLKDSLKDIDRKYDYRYSRIIDVFGKLLAEGMISKSDLEGLSADKVKDIENFADVIKSLIMRSSP